MAVPFGGKHPRHKKALQRQIAEISSESALGPIDAALLMPATSFGGDLTEESMKGHRSPYILFAGVAALALSAAGCTSSAEKVDDSLGQGVNSVVFAKRMHTTVSDDGSIEINIGGGTSQ